MLALGEIKLGSLTDIRITTHLRRGLSFSLAIFAPAAVRREIGRWPAALEHRNKLQTNLGSAERMKAAAAAEAPLASIADLIN